MERLKRRWWTATVFAVASLIVVTAAISGAFQVAVLMLPSYRDDVSAWVTQVAGRPVQIGGVELVWRGLSPRLDLSNITLYDETGDAPALSAQRLSLGFSLRRLLRGSVVPGRMELSGLSLALDVDENGDWRVAGLETLQRDALPRNDQWLREFGRFEWVRLENCELRLTHAARGREPLRFMLESLELSNTGDGFEAEGELQLPIAYGDRASLQADIEGLITEPRRWSGRVMLDARGLLPQPWLRGRLAPGSRVAISELGARVEAELVSGELRRLRLDTQSGALAAGRAGRGYGAESSRLSLYLEREADIWRGEVRDLLLGEQPQLRGSLRYRPLPQGFELDAEAALLRLDRLAPWAALARALTPQAGDALARLSGEAQSLMLRWRQTGEQHQYALRGSLLDVALSTDDDFGFEALSGEFSAGHNGGRFVAANGSAPQFRLPRAFEAPLALSAVSGEARWSRAAEAWRIQAPAFSLALAGAEASGRMDLLLPDDRGRSPQLDLEANFSATDARALKPYMPRNWGSGLRGWLDRSIEKARVPRGSLRIRGPLAQFPFEQGGGEWALDLDVAGARLAYAKDWPVADPLAASLRFRGNGLTIESESAAIGGNRAERVTARFADFRDQLLVLDASLSADAARLYTLLRNMPIRKKLSGLLEQTAGSGPARVAVHLEIPLREVDSTVVSGSVQLAGAQLRYGALEEPIRDIEGELLFSSAGVRAQALRARFMDTPLQVRIEPRADTSGVVLADFDFAVREDGRGLSQYVPQFLRPHLQGSSRWRAELPIAGRDERLRLNTDLRGTALTLPAPLEKPADQALPLNLVLGADAQAPLRIAVNLQDRLSGDIALRRSSADGISSWRTRGVQLRFGGGNAAPAGEGLTLSGALPEVDASRWAGLLRGSDLGGLRVAGADLAVARLVQGSYALGPLRAVFAPQTDKGWSLLLSGESAAGELRWSAADGGALNARLDHLRVQTRPAPATNGASGDPTDPARLPRVDFTAAQVTLDDAALGQLRLLTTRVPGGQSVEQFSLAGGSLEMQARGQWRREAGRSDARLNLRMSSADPAAALSAFGFAPNLEAKAGRLEGELEWAPRAEGLRWTDGAGRLALQFENGTLRAVEPGAGRVLGLINFYAIPRRLLLDFRDVVNTGLGFDRIDGGFRLQGGDAVTDDLVIDAPSLRMELKGRVGLQARDYDQRVSVYPDVSSGVSLGAAFLGGPAVGALVLVAQEILDKPLDQVTQLSYQLTGGWDNPQVKRIDSKSP